MGGEGQDKKHLPNRQRRQTLLGEDDSALSGSVNNRWVCAAAHPEGAVNFSPTQFWLWIAFIEHFRNGKLLTGTEGRYSLKEQRLRR